MTSDEQALALLALAEVVQVMSGFLPSPTTALMGGADPRRIKSLRQDEVLGGGVSLAIAGAIAFLIRQPAVFFGAMLILGIFLFRFESQIRKAIRDEQSGEPITRPAWY